MPDKGGYRIQCIAVAVGRTVEQPYEREFVVAEILLKIQGDIGRHGQLERGEGGDIEMTVVEIHACSRVHGTAVVERHAAVAGKIIGKIGCHAGARALRQRTQLIDGAGIWPISGCGAAVGFWPRRSTQTAIVVLPLSKVCGNKS